MSNNNDNKIIEDLLPDYFAGLLDKSDREMVEAWMNLSEDNEVIFNDAEKVWDSIGLLNQMKQFDHRKALQKVHQSIEEVPVKIRVLHYWQKVAAILIIPFMLAFFALYFFDEKRGADIGEIAIAYNTIKTNAGMQSQFTLPDGSKVWLNAASELTYPVNFSSSQRKVAITGEAFFDVVHNEEKPFVVNAGKVNVEVLGTCFNVINYPEDKHSEVILESGSVNLFTGEYENKTDLSELRPGERSVYDKEKNSLQVTTVETAIYTSWKEGKLIFRDDSMEDVATRLGRWFNVQINLQDEILKEYEYTATFVDESLNQVLELLKVSAPIQYEVSSRTKNGDDTYEKRIVTISYRK